MKRVIVTAIAIVMAMLKVGQAQTVDCDQVFTNLERAICADRELVELDMELDRLSQLAVKKNVLSDRAIREIRNDLALRCGLSENITACLIARERDAIAQLAQVTGLIVEIPAIHRPPGATSSDRMQLQSRLEHAANTHQKTGQVEELVVVTFELLEMYSGESLNSLSESARAYEIQALKSRLVAGCNNLKERRYWQRALQAQGKTCDDAFRVDNRG